jgi:thioredoxin reductase (NADPH)
MEVENITVISSKECPKGFLIREYLHRNLVHFDYFEYPESEMSSYFVNECNVSPKSFPLVLFKDNSFKTDPQLFEVAQRIGHHQKPKKDHYDLVIMGAGPAGLTAAVYGGSEGLKTVLIERHSPGGRAGSTSLIENLIGHPKGITGEEFTKSSIEQAEKFGVEFVSPAELNEVIKEGDLIRISMSGGAEITCSSLIIAVGVRYQLLDVPNAERLTGAGVFYGAAMTEGLRCKDKEVYVVGGANSAGQAAMYFSRFASRVNLIVRADTIRKRMSHYLVEEIHHQPNINILANTKIMAVYGDGYLSSMDIRNLKSGVTSNISTDNLFLLIGGIPHTECLSGVFVRDENGFLLTGGNLENHPDYKSFWQLTRRPFHLETNIPGVMAIGDVRHGSAKRMAAAIGDGATAVSLVHDYIATLGRK